MGIVNSITGQVDRVEYEKKFSITDGKEHIWTPHKRLESLNSTQWDEEKLKIFSYQKEIDELKQRITLKEKQNEAIEKTGLANNEEYTRTLIKNKQDIDLLTKHIHNVHQHLDSSVSETFNKFQKALSTTRDKEFKQEAEEFEKSKEKIKKEFSYNEINTNIHKVEQQLRTLEEQARNASEEERKKLQENYNQLKDVALDLRFQKTKEAVTEITAMPTPDIWRPISEFAIDNTAKTMKEVMLRSYEKFKENSPVLAVENFWPNTPMSTAQDLKKVVEEARKAFAEELVQKKNIPEEKAQQLAEKFIAATWDIGHIYNLRKAGYEGKELEQEVIKQTKEVAPVVRHVHVTDNFGFHDSHLPPGMGHVPVAQIMKELDDKWQELRAKGQLQIEPRSIIEGGGLIVEIGQDPTLSLLGFFNSPLYNLGTGGKGYWQADTPFGHYRTLSMEFPQQHFNLYGSSFTTLPKELGGQVGGEKSRFSDTPMN